MKHFFTLSFFFFLVIELKGQYSPIPESDQSSLTIKNGAFISFGESSYWLRANNSQRFRNHGTHLFYTYIFLQRKAHPTQKLDFFYGFEVLGSATTKFSGNIIQGFGGITFSNLSLTLGRKEELFGYNEASLGFGNLVNGNNARPMPKVSIQTVDWQPIIGTYVSFKAYLANGWFETDRYQSQALLHQKYLHFRFQPPALPVSLNFGITHNAQWGGRNLQNGIHQPSGWRDFLRIFTASKGGDKALETDQINALGNHLGTWDFQTTLRLGEFWKASNYIQWLWEDGSGLKPKNWHAGIYGLVIKNEKSHSKLGFEIVDTSKQGGSLNGIGSGPDNYFNNGVYRSGWTYHNQIIGSPIFILDKAGQLSNKINNVVQGLSLFAEGAINQFNYGISYRQFKNSGTKLDPLTDPTFLKSISVTGKINFQRSTLQFETEYDWGRNINTGWGLKIEFQTKVLFHSKKEKVQ